MSSPKWQPSRPTPGAHFPQYETQLDVARRIPGGFAGVLYHDSTTAVYLVHPEQLRAAVAALQNLPPDVPFPRYDYRFAKAERVRWSFEELYAWYRYLIPRMASAAISSASMDALRSRITITVADERAVSTVAARIHELGVPCYLVYVSMMPYPRLGRGLAPPGPRGVPTAFKK